MRERAITRAVALVDIALIVPTAVAVKGLGIHPHAHGDRAHLSDRDGRLCRR